MRMLAGLGVALVLVAVGYMDHASSTGLGDVSHCLRGKGASVESAPAGRGGAPWRNLVGSGESSVYEIDLDGDRGTLLRLGRGVGSGQLERTLDAEGTRVTAQSSGRILVLWQGRPAAKSAAALNRCLR
jgi:hypothetical protein